MANETLNILALLIERSGISIREVSKLRNVNYKTAYNAIMALEKKGVVRLEKLGNTTKCHFAHKLDSMVYAAEDKRRSGLLKDKNIKVLYEKLNRLQFPFITLVFGSHAKRAVKKGSDLDILSISEKERVPEIESAISLLPLKIHLTAVTTKEFLQMSKSREFSVVSEAAKNNILLVGIEDYYRLVENAG